MYLFLTSGDSFHAYPNNHAGDFTISLSQRLITKDMEIGLCELSVTPKKVDECANDDSDTCDDDAKSTDGQFIYVMLPQCVASESHGHRHPILRMVALSEFDTSTSLIRFPDIAYVPFREFQLSELTVWIRKAPGITGDCCLRRTDLLQGITRCTFHIRQIC